MREDYNRAIELEKGIFQFGPISQPRENTGLRIFVHPYCAYYKDNLFYVRTRDKIIQEEVNPIIMLVDENDLKSTIKKYRRPLFKDYRMIVETEYSDPQPKTKSWKELKKLIREEFNPRNILISGAELHLTDGGYYGCVGNAFEHLKELKPKIQLETCYIVDEDWKKVKVIPKGF